jgi:hypothetical protein
MAYRIYVDESGTHSDDWLIIGMLFVPDHGTLHSELCQAKESLAYFNASPKHSARYKETHLREFRSPRDVDVAKRWIDSFCKLNCYYRCVVVDWSLWDGSYFGDPFEPEALKKRRAYKKWAEMLLHPELKDPTGSNVICDARLFLDRLRIAYGYDALSELKLRFTENYHGAAPYIKEFQDTDSWRDANQCLQLCDLLTGCLYQELVPANRAEKLAARDYLASSLKTFGVDRLAPGFWKQFNQTTLNQHLPKFSAWFWQPLSRRERRAKSKKNHNRKH